MTIRRIVLFLVLVLAGPSLCAQDLLADSSLTESEKKFLDSLDKELTALMDAGKKPVSFVDLSITAASSYYDFKEPNTQTLSSSAQLTFLPSAAYYHKSGFALGGTACGIYESSHLNFYQFNLSPSFAYSRNKYFSTGIAYTHFFSKDSLGFYTTPINNELFFNASLKKGWLLPVVAVGYGWGTQASYRKEINYVKALRLRAILRYLNNHRNEKVRDLAISFSLKHNFTWHHVGFRKAFLLVTPQVMITAATQQFGFNTSDSYGSHLVTSNLLPSNKNLKNSTGLGWQSATFLLKADYSIRNFYIQPQFILDYYLPQTNDQRLRTIGGIMIGYNF